MVSSLIVCGNHSFPREEDDDFQDERAVRSAGSSPRRSTRSRGHSKNPYSTRGLDKFSLLLAEIEEKRQKIYSEISPDEISFVQFDYSKDNNCKPIVVKAKAGHETGPKTRKMKRTKTQEKHVLRRHSSGPLDHHGEMSQPLQGDHAPMQRNRSEVGPAVERSQERRLLRSFELQDLKKPKYYLPMVVIVILMFLALFGRSVAIMCTSIGWYLIPSIANGDGNLRRRSFKKKVLMGHQGGVTSFKGLSHGTSSPPKIVRAS